MRTLSKGLNMAKHKLPIKLPDFLEDVALTEASVQRLAPIMANWLTAHTYIRTLEPSAASLEELKKMLSYEIQVGKRLHMLLRLRGRFNNLRIQHEDRQLFAR